MKMLMKIYGENKLIEMESWFVHLFFLMERHIEEELYI